ncbi:transposase [Vibrio cholerae]|uniref:transposase n=1 Tax=Vibrio cholerae TaxID=666 RepID=UPI0036FA26F8
MISSSHKLIGDILTKRTRRLFSAEFKLEAAQLVLDQNYSVTEAAQAMNVGMAFSNKTKFISPRKLLG